MVKNYLFRINLYNEGMLVDVSLSDEMFKEMNPFKLHNISYMP